MRQGLKSFSNWPTYPQLYIDGFHIASHFESLNVNPGELIGGLDIIKEMVESGELQTMLPKKVAKVLPLTLL